MCAAKFHNFRVRAMRETCVICGKEVTERQGFVSNTGIVVCSELCKVRYCDTLPNRGEGQLVVYSRVTGYYTPVSSWNKGKQREHIQRKKYSVREALRK